MTNKILKTLKGDNDNKFFDGISEAEINDFESKINVKLPDLLKNLYLEINGGYDGSLLEFYSLEKIKNIDDFDFGYFVENKSGKNIIWSINENEVKKCFIKNHKFYYSFMNYNFGGAYWFINLNKYDKKYGEILLLYNHLNEYYKCQSNIDKFFKLYTDYGSIEILLDSEIEIKKYLKEKEIDSIKPKNIVVEFLSTLWKK